MQSLVVLVLALVASSAAFGMGPARVRTSMPVREDVSMISHGKGGVNRLGRPADQRKALVRGLTTEVIRHGRIRTTLTKAKAIRKYVDRMITLAKKGTPHHRRQALSFLYDPDLVTSLFDAAPERYMERQGGYCRVIKEDLPRRGDAAPMAVIELV